MSNEVYVLEKIRCVVVDDEALIRERFRYAFPLEDNGYEIVGEAEDGEEALELCRQLHPDIVITDIVMPRMNGLELTEKLRTLMPRVKVIILSSFQEFEFARQAVSLGAMGYLLKVTSGYQELLDILEKARREIEADREALLAAIEERKQLQDSQPFLRRQLVEDLRSGTINSVAKLNSQCDFVEWRRPGFVFSIGLVDIDRFGSMKQTFHEKDMALFKYVLMRMIEEISDKAVPCNVFPWTSGSVGLWLLHPDRSGDERLDGMLNDISRYVRQYLPFTVSVRVGKVREFGSEPSLWPALLNGAFGELERLRVAQFYGGHGGVYHADTAGGANGVAGIASGAGRNAAPELPDPISLLAEAAHEAQLPWLVRERYIEPWRHTGAAPEAVRGWLAELTKRWTTANEVANRRFLGELSGLETIHDVEEYMLRLIAWKRNDSRLTFDQPVQRAEIQKALDYVAKHYSEPISVAEISKHTAMSPNYFSHLFKAQTGINFSEYVTRYRIEISKQLLAATELPVHEIAEQTGIPDYKYFTRIFRRLTGKTPSEYRKAPSGG